MLFPTPPVYGVLIARSKRFLADIRLDDGRTLTAHCANTGSMMQVSEPGSRVMLTPADRPERTTRWDWQAVMANGRWTCINTSAPNRLLREGFEAGLVGEFRGYDTIRTEVPYGMHSRVDAVLSGPRGEMYVEAKNVTLVENGRALFPDAVTARGTRHLEELIGMVKRGARAAVFFAVQRAEAGSLGAAAHIDPVWAERLEEAVEEGVEIIAWRTLTTPEGVFLDRPVPFVREYRPGSAEYRTGAGLRGYRRIRK